MGRQGKNARFIIVVFAVQADALNLLQARQRSSRYRSKHSIHSQAVLTIYLGYLPLLCKQCFFLHDRCRYVIALFQTSRACFISDRCITFAEILVDGMSAELCRGAVQSLTRPSALFRWLYFAIDCLFNGLWGPTRIVSATALDTKELSDTLASQNVYIRNLHHQKLCGDNLDVPVLLAPPTTTLAFAPSTLLPTQHLVDPSTRYE